MIRLLFADGTINMLSIPEQVIFLDLKPPTSTSTCSFSELEVGKIYKNTYNLDLSHPSVFEESTMDVEQGVHFYLSYIDGYHWRRVHLKCSKEWFL